MVGSGNLDKPSFPITANAERKFAFVAEGGGQYSIRITNPGEQPIKYTLVVGTTMPLIERCSEAKSALNVRGGDDRCMAPTTPFEDGNAVNFAPGVLDNFIAKHDLEAIREQGKGPTKVAAGLRGGAKGRRESAKNLSERKRKAIARKVAETHWKRR
jgi:hypothetical protein